ncbi:hypothetical protein [Succinimonas sp.]|uniref:hypothetical protein n=1 Tax=Succinimonas sp. TaxID=1936151 RepID=UPI0038670239
MPFTIIASHNCFASFSGFFRNRRSSTAETLQKIAGISVTAVNNIHYKGFKSREIKEQFLVKDNNGVTHGIKSGYVFSDARR